MAVPVDGSGPDRAPLIVTRRRGRAAPLLWLPVALCGALLLIAQTSTERAAGWAGVVVFGAAAVIIALPRRRGPLLVLDDLGLTDTASGTAAGFVPWSAVAGVLEQRTRGQRYLSVLLHDPVEVLRRADPAVRAAMRANLTLLGTPVNIPLRPLSIGVAQLTLELARRTPAALPAALSARPATGVPGEGAATVVDGPRPPASPERLAELTAAAAEAGLPLPPAYLELLGAQDGFRSGSLRVFGSRPEPGLAGVLEANREWRALAGAEGVSAEHVLLAEDDAYRYAAHVSSSTFQVLARSDHRPMTQVSTFSDLIVSALQDLPHPLG